MVAFSSSAYAHGDEVLSFYQAGWNEELLNEVRRRNSIFPMAAVNLWCFSPCMVFPHLFPPFAYCRQVMMIIHQEGIKFPAEYEVLCAILITCQASMTAHNLHESGLPRDELKKLQFVRR